MANTREAKTGQSIDPLKEGLIHPLILGCILQIPNLATELSFFDFGSGDASSSQNLLISLILNGMRIKKTAFFETDTKIFSNLVRTTFSNPIDTFSNQVVLAQNTGVISRFTRQYESSYDVAVAQLVLHQILNRDEASYFLFLAFQALKETGDLLIVNLHPKYLQDLEEHEPQKFVVKSSTENEVTGVFSFDTSGSTLMCSRSPQSWLATLLALGFDFIQMVPIFTDSIQDHNPRYHRLAENKIPIFYLLQLRKNPFNFVSSTQGIVRKIETCDNQWIRVTFLDAQEIHMPGFKDWQKVQIGDYLILHETRMKNISAITLNYWVIDSNENIIGGRIRCQKGV